MMVAQLVKNFPPFMQTEGLLQNYKEKTLGSIPSQMIPSVSSHTTS